MSLQTIYTTLNTLINGLPPGQPLQVGYEQVGNDTNFYYLLLLLKQDTLTVYSPTLTWKNNQQELDLSGNLLIYNSSSTDFTLAFTEDGGGQLVSKIAGTLPALNIGDLTTLQLIDPSNDSIQYFPDVDFANVALSAASDTLSMELKAIKSNTGWNILGLPLFPLKDIGYLFTSTIVAGSPAGTPQFWVTGTFQLGQTVILLSVKVPVGPMDTKDQWLANFSLPKPLQNTFQDLSNLLFFNNLNNLVPSAILQMPPGNDDKGIFLDQLAILFTLTDRSIQYLNIAISAKGEWALGPVKLTYSNLLLGFVPGTAAKGMSLSIQFSLTMVFGTLDPLTLTLDIPSIKDNWTVQLFSGGDMNSMADIANVPGSVSKDQFYFPPALDSATTGLTLKDFTAVFNPFAGTWDHVSIEINYTAEWYVIPGFFEIEAIDLLLAVDNDPDTGVTITGSFSTDLFLGGADGFGLTLYAEKRATSWFFSARAEDIHLTQIIKQLLANSFTLPSYIPEITVDYLELTIDTADNTYTGAGKISMEWPIEIAGTVYHLDTSVEANIKAQRGLTTPQYSGSVQGIINVPDAPGFGNAALVLTYTFGKDDIYTATFLGATITFTASTGLINLNLGDHSLGDLVTMMIGWAEPNSTVTLEAPWDLLNNISLKSLNFFFNIKDKSFGFEYKPGNGVNLGFVTINGLGLKYVKDAQFGNYKVELVLDGQLFGKPIPAWDLLNPDTAPKVPGQGDSNFDLDFLALGQHVSLRDTTKIHNLDQAITAYKSAFIEPPDPGKVPITDQTPIVFNAAAGWMIGARFIVMNTVEIGVIFNDPELYGLLVRLSGEKAKLFAGLEFQIIYKKVSDTVGVYEIELKLPDAMRHLEFGEVSITLPVIGLQIYTNGNFRVDVGFPWNNDFSRSFSVQAFPFIGSGGFYFAWLNSETSTNVPRITSGNFNPVIEFGIGLALGLGKTIDEGILSGGLSVMVTGILQGVIGFYNPNPLPDGTSATSGANYYALQGTISIVGRVYGSIDFAIIKASLDITVYVLARITFICYEPIPIYLEAGVRVTLTVSIDLGLFSIDIHLSFSATLKETFTIGHASTPPWTLATQQKQQLLGAHHAGFFSNSAVTPIHKIAMSWIPLKYPVGTTPPALEIYFMPTLTVALDESSGSPAQTARYMTMLYVEAATSFTGLAKSIIAWAINANTTDKTWTTDLYPEVLTQTIDINYLQNIYTYFTCQPGATVAATDANSFLQNGFTVNVIYQSSASTGSLSASIFPMFPLLKQSATLNGQAYGTPVDFASYNTVSQQYQQDITAYFEKITVNFLDPLEAAVDDCALYAETTFVPIIENSMAAFIYQDYFLLIAKAGIGEAIKLMKSYPYDYQGEVLTTLAGQFGIGAASILEANRSLIATQNLQLGVTGIVHALSGTDQLNTLAAEYAVTVSDIIGLNRTDTAILQGSVTVSLNDGSASYTTQPGDSFQTIANHLTMDPAVDTLSGSIPDLVAVTNISGLSTLFVAGKPLPIHPPRYTICPGDTLNGIVNKYNPGAAAGSLTIYSLCAINAIVSGLLAPGIQLTVGSNPPYAITGADTLLSIADRLAAGNLNTLADAIAGLALFQPAALAFLPALIYNTNGTSDTFDTIANQFSLSIDILAANNPTLEKAWPNSTSIVLVNIASLSIGALTEKLEATNALTNLAGMAARFLLHGLRLPAPTPLSHARLTAAAGWETALDTHALYELTGQHIDLPTLTATDTFDMVLAAGSAGWINFQTISGPGGATPATQLTVTLTTDDIGKVNTVQATTLNPTVTLLRPQPAYMENGRQYILSNPAPWLYNSIQPLWSAMAPGVVPTLWPLPDTLLQAAFDHKTLLPLVKLWIGTHDNPTAKLTKTAVTLFERALQIPLTISRVPAGVPGEDTVLPHIYQINSTDEAGLVYLERLIVFNQQQKADILAAVHILYTPNPTGNRNSGYQSNGLDATTAFVLKTNFSTEGHPAAHAAEAAAALLLNPNAVVLSSTPRDIVERIWEASIVQTGGFYLYYAYGADGEDLPDSLFRNEQVATLQLVITFNATLPQGIIYDFINALDIGNAINTGNSILYAEAQDQSVSYPYASTTTFVGITNAYNILIDDLGIALQDNTLNTQLPFTIGNLQYEVAPGDSFTTIVAYFGVGQTNFSQALQNANPNLSPADYATVWTLVSIPPIAFVTGVTNPALDTLNKIAQYYHTDMAALASEVQTVPGLFSGSVSFTDRIVDRVAVIAPGNAGIELQRQIPATGRNLAAGDYLSNVYNLLGISIAANTGFSASGEGLPATSRDLDTAIPGSARLAALTAENSWQYVKVLPVAPYSLTNNMIAKDAIPALLASNPYAGVGGTMQVDMEWLDLYGNRTKTPWNFPGSYPPGTPGPLNYLPVNIRYTDALIPPEKWPNLALNFLYQDVAGAATLELIFHFDVSKYAVYQPVDPSLPVNPRDPASPTRGEQFATDLKTVLKNAQKDLQTYRNIYYQVWQQDLTMTVSDTMNPTPWPLTAAQQEQVRAQLNAIYVYLTGLIRTQFVYTYYEVQPADIKDNPYDTAVYLAGTLGVKDVNALIAVNLGLRQPFGIDGNVNNDYKIIVPSLALPAPLQLSQPRADENPAPIFELDCLFTLQRSAALVDDYFVDVAGVGSVRSTLKPIANTLAWSLGQYDSSFGLPGSGTLTLTDFAGYFEAAYGQQYLTSTYKIATGTPLKEAITSGSSSQLWVVRFGNRGVQFHIAGQPWYFAPAPLANSLLSFTGPKAIPIKPFDKNSGLGVAVNKNFAGVSLDVWAKLCLDAIDQFLLPVYAVPAYIVDQYTPTGNDPVLPAILGAKVTLAKAIVSNLAADPANSRFLNILKDPAIAAGSLTDAQEALRQLLLINLGSAYTVDAVVQFQAAVVSPYPDSDQPVAPNLYGQPLAVAATTVSALHTAGRANVPVPPPPPVYSLSTAKLPLTNGGAWFTFTFSTKNQQDQKSFVLDLAYQVNQIEYDVTPVTVTGFAAAGRPVAPGQQNAPGQQDYNASTWLNFVTPLASVPILAQPTKPSIEIPVPLRAYPIPPSLVSQIAEPHTITDPDDKKRLQELLQWQYSYTYSQVESAQDSMDTSLQFNIDNSPKLKTPAVLTPGELLFANLAQFNEVYPAIAQVFTDTLATITPASKTTDMDTARIAMQAFATIIVGVAETWAAWRQPTANSYTLAGTPATYHLEEKKLPYKDPKKPIPNTIDVLCVTVTATNGTTFDSPQVAIAGFTTETAPAGYIFRSQDTGNLLLYSDRSQYKQRELTYAFVNILSSQNAWASLSEIRNADLVNGNPTTPNFIYKTPDIRFANPLVPYLDTINYPQLQPFNVYLLGSAPPAPTAPLVSILGDFFATLFSVISTGTQKIKLGVSYAYTLTVDPASPAITLPVYITPPVDFHIPGDYTVTPGCADTPNGASFVCQLAYYLAKWLTDADPVENNARFLFDLSIYSSLDTSQMPLVRIRDLYLLIANIGG